MPRYEYQLVWGGDSQSIYAGVSHRTLRQAQSHARSLRSEYPYMEILRREVSPWKIYSTYVQGKETEFTL